MRRVAGCNEAVRVEHQRFVGTCLIGLDTGGDAVQLGQAVPFWILGVWCATMHMHGEEAEGFDLPCLLVLRNDDNRRTANIGIRMLIGRFF